MNYFYVSTNHNLFNSLQRYFKYLLGEELIILADDLNCQEQNIRIFLPEDDKFENKFLRIINRLKNCEVFLLGSGSNYNIDPVLTSQLSDKLKSALNSDFQGTAYKPSELKEKLNAFFKGHGEQSLIGCLGQVIYFIDNYKCLAAGESYQPEGLRKYFLEPGLKSWKEFTRRFNKYSVILCLAGRRKKH